MKEIQGDFWALAPNYNILCVTTNNVVKANGELVMGAGIAKQFKERYPELPKVLGDFFAADSNRNNEPRMISLPSGPTILTFPTKYHWKNPSSLQLIRKSAEFVQKYLPEGSTVLLTRPGCGCGGLEWEKQVKPVLAAILDDRFTVVSQR